MAQQTRVGLSLVEPIAGTQDVIPIGRRAPRRTPPKPKPVGTAPAKMALAFLECHAEGHWWKRIGDTDVVLGPRKRLLEFTRHSLCHRCGETRRVKRAADLRVVSRSYTQPEGFRMALKDGQRGQTRYLALMELNRREGIVR